MFITFDNYFKAKLSLTQKTHAHDDNAHKQHNKPLHYSAAAIIRKAIFTISLAGYIT
jgi:cell envelope opacity-associated protein A